MTEIARQIETEELRWFSEEIKPRMAAGMSFDEAYVAAGGTIIDVPNLFGAEQSGSA